MKIKHVVLALLLSLLGATVNAQITDAFPYSNGALSSQGAWSVTAFDGTLTVTSNAVTGTTSGSRANLRSDAWGSTQSSEVEITFSDSNMYPGVIVHGSGGTFAGYLFGIDTNGNWFLERYDAGTPTTLANGASSAPGPGTNLKIEIQGSNVVCSIEGSQVANVSDTTYRAGKPGMFMYRESSVITIDNWVGTGEVGGGGSGLLLRRRRAANDDHFDVDERLAAGF